MEGEVNFLPEGRTVRARTGVSLLEAGRRAGAGIRTRCGGKAACLMCKVRVEAPAGLSPLTPNERNKLGGLAEEGYRLACQAKITGKVTVHVPEDPLKAAVRALLAKQKEQDEG